MFSWFFMFCFFENERRAGEMIFMIFFLFCFLLFIASDGAAFLYLSVFTVSHYFFFFKCSVLLFLTLALSEVALS